MSDALHSQWARLAGFIVGYQATWITDIGLKTGLFQGDRRRPPPSEWKVAYRKLAAEVGINPELAAGYREGSDLLNEILAGRQKGSWDPVQGQWV